MRAQKKDKAIKIVLVIVMVALAASALVNYIYKHDIKTTVIPDKKVYESYDAYGFVCAEEYLMEQAFDGKLTAVTGEGERVGKNQAVYALQRVGEDGGVNETMNYFYAPVAGLVSYYTDGYEKWDDVEEIAALDLPALYEQLKQSHQEREEALKNGQATGQVACEIINNVGELRLVCTLAKSDYTEKLKDAKNVRAVFPELGIEESFQIKALIEKGDNVVLDLQTAAAWDKLYLQRVVKMQVGHYVDIKIVLPTEAIIYRDGEAGVYVISKKFVLWRAVELVDMDQETGGVIVQGLNEGDEVVLDAQKVKEGMYIR